MLAWGAMKTLGLLGVLLWLGTLLASAGGAEKARIDCTFSNEWSVPEFAPPALSAAKAEDAAKKDVSGLVPDLAIPPASSPALSLILIEAFPFRSRGVASRCRLMVVWHLGRGPPPGVTV